MANTFVSDNGSYDKTVEDSSHQASNKFSNPIAKPKDDVWVEKKHINEPVDPKDTDEEDEGE